MPLELQTRIWPTEDFQLVRSLIGVELPESDLFAGVAQYLMAQPVLTWAEGSR